MRIRAAGTPEVLAAAESPQNSACLCAASREGAQDGLDDEHD